MIRSKSRESLGKEDFNTGQITKQNAKAMVKVISY
jgi:hypothetical protein